MQNMDWNRVSGLSSLGSFVLTAIWFAKDTLKGMPAAEAVTSKPFLWLLGIGFALGLAILESFRKRETSIPATRTVSDSFKQSLSDVGNPVVNATPTIHQTFNIGGTPEPPRPLVALRDLK